MDALLAEGFIESADLYDFEPLSSPIFLRNQQNFFDEVKHNQPFEDRNLVHSHSFPSTDSNQKMNTASCYSEISNADHPQVSDFPDDCLKYISEILMDEDLDDKLGAFYDYRAIEATEKDLYDALGEAAHPSDPHDLYFNPDFDFQRSLSSHGSSYHSTGKSAADLNFILSPGGDETTSPDGNSITSSPSSVNFGDTVVDLPPVAFPVTIPSVPTLNNEGEFDWFSEAIKSAPENYNCIPETGGNQIVGLVADQTVRRDVKGDASKVRKNHWRDENDHQDSGRSNKLLAAYNEDQVQIEQFDDVLLWKGWKDELSIPKGSDKPNSKGNKSKVPKGSKGRGKKQTEKQEVVDLGSLLILCAQAVSSFDTRNANELLKQIKQNSSPYGDSTERVAHYFVLALEARIAGNGSQLSVHAVCDNHIPIADLLRSYRTYVEAVPLRRMSYYLANQTIGKLAGNATTIHVIDFGIFCGFQWPCFIQCLSKRASGPPKLRITGIGFPQRGFKPAAMVEETGRRLEGYCKRFNVPFEYNSIAKRWDEISLDDFKLNKDEILAVNCVYESRAMFDETLEDDSPRDAFLRLIKSLNPTVFVHGIISSTLNAPFFMTRFREAFFHYSAIFDMLEATIPREDPERQLIERELYGKAVMNVIGCEGSERMERPETFKQWRVRTLRAGFRQLPLDRGVMGMLKEKVKANYHKDFVVGEDGEWMVQGWKGRILYAMSFWKPVQD